ncbi:hypothetical protein SAMD00023353_2001570 [Rosellinia necatrix]|uniref:Uncharacterized protein n=1 Tax=Rosellinia necatrix TaxID=77044 RepID=A0A1W2TEX9_ROSNE|nr:hypothetical protein SAMD00023353_2001570 [Rosellinia necatrix]
MPLCFQAVAEAGLTASKTFSPQRKSSSTSDVFPGVWGLCGSKYGLEPADTTGAIECATMIGVGRGDTISVSVDDEPRLLCDDYGAKIWIAPFTNKPDLTVNSFTFKTIDVINMTLNGAVTCCDYKVSPTCSGWGMLSEVRGRQDVLISINHADTPEMVAYNDVDH